MEPYGAVWSRIGRALPDQDYGFSHRPSPVDVLPRRVKFARSAADQLRPRNAYRAFILFAKKT